MELCEFLDKINETTAIVDDYMQNSNLTNFSCVGRITDACPLNKTSPKVIFVQLISRVGRYTDKVYRVVLLNVEDYKDIRENDFVAFFNPHFVYNDFNKTNSIVSYRKIKVFRDKGVPFSDYYDNCRCKNGTNTEKNMPSLSNSDEGVSNRCLEEESCGRQLDIQDVITFDEVKSHISVSGERLDVDAEPNREIASSSKTISSQKRGESTEKCDKPIFKSALDDAENTSLNIVHDNKTPVVNSNNDISNLSCSIGSDSQTDDVDEILKYILMMDLKASLSSGYFYVFGRFSKETLLHMLTDNIVQGLCTNCSNMIGYSKFTWLTADGSATVPDCLVCKSPLRVFFYIPVCVQMEDDQSVQIYIFADQGKHVLGCDPVAYASSDHVRASFRYYVMKELEGKDFTIKITFATYNNRNIPLMVSISSDTSKSNESTS